MTNYKVNVEKYEKTVNDNGKMLELTLPIDDTQLEAGLASIGVCSSVYSPVGAACIVEVYIAHDCELDIDDPFRVYVENTNASGYIDFHELNALARGLSQLTEDEYDKYILYLDNPQILYCDYLIALEYFRALEAIEKVLA